MPLSELGRVCCSRLAVLDQLNASKNMHRNTAILQQRRENAQILRDSLREAQETAAAEVASAQETEKLLARRSVRREAMQFRHMLNASKDASLQGRRRLAVGLSESSDKALNDDKARLAHSDYLSATLEQRMSTKHQQQANVYDGTSAFSKLARPTLVGSLPQPALHGSHGRSDQLQHSSHGPSIEQTTPSDYFALLLQAEGGIQVKDEKTLHSARTFQDALASASDKTKQAVFTRAAVIAEVEAALRMHARLLQQLEQRVQQRRELHASVLAAAQARRQDAAAVDAAAYGSLPIHKWPVSARRRRQLHTGSSIPSFGEDISVIASAASDEEGGRHGFPLVNSTSKPAPQGGGGSTAETMDTAASMASILSYSGRGAPPIGGEALREALSGGGMFRSSTADRVRATSMETHDMRGMAMADPQLREWLLQRYAHFKWEAFMTRDEQARRAAIEAREAAGRQPERASARAVRGVDVAISPSQLPPGGGGGAAVGGAVVAAATNAFEAEHGTAADSDSDDSGADTPRGGVAAVDDGFAGGTVPPLDLGAGEHGGGAEAAAAAHTASDSLDELQAVLNIYRSHMAGSRHPAPGSTLHAVRPLQQASSAARVRRGARYKTGGRPHLHMRPSCRVDQDTNLPMHRPRIPSQPGGASLALLASASTAAGELPLVPPLPLYPPAGDASSNAAAAMTAATVQRALHARAAPSSARGRLQGRALAGVPAAVAADRPAWPSSAESQEALQTATSLTGTPKDMIPTHRNTGTLSASVTRALTHDCRLDVAWRDAGNFSATWSSRRGKAARQRQHQLKEATAREEAADAVAALDSFGRRQHELAPAQAAATARAHALPRAGDVFPGVWAEGSIGSSDAPPTPSTRRGALAASAAGMLDPRAGVSKVYSTVGPQWSPSIHLHRQKGAPTQHMVAATGCEVLKGGTSNERKSERE